MNRQYGGTGLGLWISKSIIELMGGSITATSSLGKGSTFIIKIPAKVCSETEIIKESEEMDIAIPILKGKKMLIVDDIPENTYILKEFLEKKEIIAIASNDGADALQIYKRQKDFHAIITDLRMPGMSGQTFITEIRKAEKELKIEPVPIAVLTAESDPIEKFNCLNKYGANEYLLKPVKLNILMLTLSRLIGKENKSQAKNIVVLEDELISANIIKNILTSQGNLVTLCKTIEEVI